MSPNVMSVNEIAIPKIADDEVLLASRSVGICHSDIELLEGRYIIPFNYPIIPGHEWSAEVMEVGSKVSKLKAGDRVVGECVIGQEHFGFSISGAMAEFFIAKADWLHKLPANVSWTQGALVEPFSCGYYATVRAENMDASDTVAVFGAGPIGLGVIAASAAKGARVIVIEPSADRAKIAQSLGAELVIDPIKQNTKEAVMDATKGVGATIVIDASGRPEAMAQTLEVAAFHGRVVIIGISVGGKAQTEMGLIQSKELQVRGIIGSPGVWPETIRFLSRTNLDLSKLVTSSFDISDADKAYQKVLTDKSQVKVHVTNSGK
ncbi:zinc-dependent alcohol dehydrogenase [Candidatus Planktophila versatilis]|uniref:zinc-dependent alcohol dehydrogenase n=1 Tax=Candidatus Planktophila versatilis TaxID=1884905 RepID=UPI001CBB8949|nr:zinc-binding dehydrogenase [Candidatus Planktophila versatilis]